MAGATNAQMKSAGWKARDISKARAEHGKINHNVMVRSGFSPKKGTDPGGRREAKAAVVASSVRSLTANIVANRKAMASRKPPRRERSMADYERVAQKLSASVNDAVELSRFRPSEANADRVGRRAQRLLSFMERAQKVGFDYRTMSKQNPYAKSGETLRAKVMKREREADKREKQKRADREAGRRSFEFLYNH